MRHDNSSDVSWSLASIEIRSAPWPMLTLCRLWARHHTEPVLKAVVCALRSVPEDAQLGATRIYKIILSIRALVNESREALPDLLYPWHGWQKVPTMKWIGLLATCTYMKREQMYISVSGMVNEFQDKHIHGHQTASNNTSRGTNICPKFRERSLACSFRGTTCMRTPRMSSPIGSNWDMNPPKGKSVNVFSSCILYCYLRGYKQTCDGCCRDAKDMCDLWSDIHRQKRGNDPLNELECSYPHSRRFDQTLQ